MSVSAIGSGTNYDAYSMAQALMKKIDTDNDGGISQSEFKSALSQASSSNSSSSKDTVTIFNYLDSDSNNSINQSELETFLKKLSAANNSSSSNSTTTGQTSAQPSGGAGGAGGVGGAGGAGGTSGTSSSGSTSASSLYYDVRDTNQDGVVSMEEELAYEAQHLSETLEKQSSNSNTNSNSNYSQYQNAIAQYQKNEGVYSLQSASLSQLSVFG